MTDDPVMPASSPWVADDWRGWLVALVSGAAAYVSASHGLFFFAASWQISLLVACVVGLVAATPLRAALIASAVMLTGIALLPPVLPSGTGAGIATYALALGLSAAFGYLVARTRLSLARERQRLFSIALAAMLVLWIVVNLWLPLLGSANGTAEGYSTLPAAFVREVPLPGEYVYDDAIYLRIYDLMHGGEAFYPAFHDAWLGLPEGTPLPSSVAGFRLPTYFWLWRALPPDPFSIVYLYLFFATLGVVAGSLIAGQLVGAQFAPLAALALAAYALGVGGTVIALSVDLPTAYFALCGVALFVCAERRDSRNCLWAAAGLLTLAALTREILVYLLVFALLSSLLKPQGKRLASALPWFAGLGLFALGYALHARAALPYLATSSRVSYLNGGVGFMLDAIAGFASSLSGGSAAQAVLFFLGVAGCIGSHRRVGWPFAAFGTAALIIPMLVMLKLGNPGIGIRGAHINYWGTLVLPLAFAMWPAWALLLTGPPVDPKRAEQDLEPHETDDPMEVEATSPMPT